MARNNKDKIILSEIKITSPRNKDGDTLIYVSFTVEKNSQGIPDLNFVVKSPSSTQGDIKGMTDEFGYGSVNFTTKDSKVNAWVFVKYTDKDGNEKQLKKSAKEYTVREEKTVTKKTFAHASILSPEEGAKFNNVMSKVAIITGGTDKAWDILAKYLAKKTPKQVVFFQKAVIKMDKEDAPNIVRRFIRLTTDEKNRYAEKLGLFPTMDFQSVFFSRLQRFGQKSNGPKMQLWFFQLKPEDAEKFMINSCYLSDDEYENFWKEIITSDNPEKMAKNLGLFNKI